MRATAYLLLASFAAACATSLPAEDMQLRARAVQLLNDARAINTIRGGPYIIRTEAAFTATADDGSLKSGTYTRVRIPTGSLRQDLRFGDWQATSLYIDRQVSNTSGWNFPPFAVRRLLNLVPFQVGAFDNQDVVRAIRDGSSGGQEATCVDYDTVHGEHRSSNEICLSKADGTLLNVREEDRAYTYSKYSTVAGAVYPRHIDYREGTSFTLNVDITMTKLDSAPDNTLAVPAGAQTGTLCRQAAAPVPIRAPQPEAKGGADAAVTDVILRVTVKKDGTVSQPQVVRPSHPDLDAEALKLVQTWVFQPATCNGQLNEVPADVVLHFQGR